MKYADLVAPASSADARKQLADAIDFAEGQTIAKTPRVLLREYAELLAVKYSEPQSCGLAASARLLRAESRSPDPAAHRRKVYAKALREVAAMRKAKVGKSLPSVVFTASIILAQALAVLEASPKIKAFRAAQKVAHAANTRDRIALEELVEYSLGISSITASRACDLLGFDDMETLRGWRDKRAEVKK